MPHSAYVTLRQDMTGVENYIKIINIFNINKKKKDYIMIIK